MSKVDVDAFLADSVVRSEDKLYIQGAGWNRITASLFPAVHDRIGIGLLFRVVTDGPGASHGFELRLEDASATELPLGNGPPTAERPDGKIFRIGGQFSTARSPEGDEQIVPIAINFNQMPFQRPGVYRFVISVDGVDMRALPFRVQPRASQAPEATGGGGYL